MVVRIGEPAKREPKTSGARRRRSCCSGSACESQASSLANFHFVYHTTVIAEQTAPRL